MGTCRQCGTRTKKIGSYTPPTCGKSECQEAEFKANQARNAPKPRKMRPKEGALKADGTKWTAVPGGLQKLEIRNGPDDPWFNNELQFARLISEMVAAIDEHQMPILVEDLCKSMDLTQNHVYGLFDRAEEVFEKWKLKNKKP